MHITDLTEAYIIHVLSSGDFPHYERSYPALFEHYYKYWAERKNTVILADEKAVKEKSKLIRKRLDFIENNFNDSGFNIANLKIVLFVGQNTSNGHAFKDGDNYIVWLPIETYPTLKQCDIFITHEIAHFLHYSRSPDFYFHSIKNLQLLSRRLITEGIATYLTQQILKSTEKEALWADFLTKSEIDSWFEKCQIAEPQLYKFVLENFNYSNPEIELFYANDTADIFRFRAGYFVGLKLIAQMVKDLKLSMEELLKIPKTKFENMMFKQLQLKI